MRNEWSSGLDEPTKQKVHVPVAQVVKRVGSSGRSSGTLLVVKFKDGVVIYENKAADTFVRSLRKIGFEKVMTLNLKVCGFPLVSRQKCESYLQAELDGYLIMTHSSTEAKRDKLMEIASAIGIDLSVDIVPKSETYQVLT